MIIKIIIPIIITQLIKKPLNTSCSFPNDYNLFLNSLLYLTVFMSYYDKLSLSERSLIRN